MTEPALTIADRLRDLSVEAPSNNGHRDRNPLVYEAAHTAVLAAYWRDLYRWAAHEGVWRVWTGKVWETTPDAVVVADAQQTLRRHYAMQLAEDASDAEYKRLHALHGASCRYASVAAALSFLKGHEGFHTPFEAWDRDAYALNCSDGIVDVRTQTLGPHDPTKLCTRMCQWDYGDEETTGAWQRHLELCLPAADVRRQVQRDLGRALVDAVLEESLPIWYGTGANGKSTTQSALLHGLDGYGKRAVKDLLVASKFEHHPTEIADLAGARMVFSEEIEIGKRLDEALVKDLTGGGRKKARFMRQDNFEFEQTFSIFLLVNHRPQISGTDKGIWRRIRLVPWTVSIARAEQRPQDEVVRELVADGSWMLRWLVAGFADWQADHQWIADEVVAATEAYQDEQDRLGGFIHVMCECRPFVEVAADELYAAHVSWCTEEGETQMSKIAFGKELKNRGFQPRKGSSGMRLWTGLRLKVAHSGASAGLFHMSMPRVGEPDNAPLSATDGSDEELDYAF